MRVLRIIIGGGVLGSKKEKSKAYLLLQLYREM